MPSYTRPGISASAISALSIAGGTFAEFDRSGSATITLAGDTVSATGALDIAGAASITVAGDTTSATGALDIAGAASITVAGDTTTATGTLALAGAASITVANDTISAAGGVAIAGAASITVAGDTILATAENGGSGTTTKFDSVAGISTSPISRQSISGSSRAFFQTDIDVASVTVVAEAFITLSGEASITCADDTTTATGALAIVGSATLTVANVTPTVTATIIRPRRIFARSGGGRRLHARAA